MDSSTLELNSIPVLSEARPRSRRHARAEVSIHDVMPETLDEVLFALERLRGLKIEPITLLVVPGREWTAYQIDDLRRLQEGGVELAGHGWKHSVPREEIKGLKHGLHAALISSDVAEHLVLDSEGIRDLITRCAQWFEEHDLRPPNLYVPPGWAMGNITKAQLEDLPFRYYETLSGYYDVKERCHHLRPLLGYEADTTARACVLTLWNQAHSVWGLLSAPRIAIHPRDFKLKLGRQLVSRLERL